MSDQHPPPRPLSHFAVHFAITHNHLLDILGENNSLLRLTGENTGGFIQVGLPPCQPTFPVLSVEAGSISFHLQVYQGFTFAP